MRVVRAQAIRIVALGFAIGGVAARSLAGTRVVDRR
jgi:hypothetical protein